jgi:hypothetical protein
MGLADIVLTMAAPDPVDSAAQATIAAAGELGMDGAKRQRRGMTRI